VWTNLCECTNRDITLFLIEKNASRVKYYICTNSLIYDNIERYFISRNLVKVIFGKKNRKLFIFGGVILECQYSLAHIGNHRVLRQKVRRAESSVTVFDIVPAITSATLYPRIILHTAGYTRVLLSSRHFYPRFNARLPWVTFTESAWLYHRPFQQLY